MSLQNAKKSALLTFLRVFSWFVGYNAVETFFTLYGVKMLKLQPNNAAFLLSFLLLMFVVFAVPQRLHRGAELDDAKRF